MNGARIVHDQVELAGWQVEIADAKSVKGLAPPACKTEKIDAWVLAELSRRDVVPAIWLRTPDGARRTRTRPLATKPGPPSHHTEEPHPRHPARLWPASDLFGVSGRELQSGMR
jgi:transposase